MKIQNASIMPKVYYGLHFCEGVAEYRPKPNEMFRVLINENVAKKMDASFAGKPMYVQHVDDVDVRDIEKADGFVVKSFFNQSDGKHWTEFIVVTDDGHEAIAKGWKLSNAYIMKNSGLGGQWHGIDYDKEILDAEYEHLAFVPDPRYSESIILTPDQFKEYNSRKDAELKKLQNSKSKGVKTMFDIFKRTKVENSNDLENMIVVLPISKMEIALTKLINEADKKEVDKDKPQMANMKNMVKVGKEEMSVGDLVNCYGKMKKAQNESDEAAKKKELENMSDEEKEKLKAKNEEDKKKEEEKAKNEEDKKKEEAEKAKNALDKEKELEHFNKLQNAEHKNNKDVTIKLSNDQVATGKARYGSDK